MRVPADGSIQGGARLVSQYPRMERLSVVEVYSNSWSGAKAVLAGRGRFYWAWLIAAAIIGALSLLVPDSILQNKPGEPTVAPAIFVDLTAFGVMIAVLPYFILADAVRRFVPSFRMTVPVFFLTFAINMIYSIALQTAVYLLVIPAFYIGPKLWLWIPNFLLTDAERGDIGDPFARAWRDTNNLYWPTLGLMALLGFITAILLAIALAVAVVLVQVVRPLAIVATPLLLAASIYLIAQVNLAWLGWASAVRRRADSLTAAVPVTSS